MRVGFEHSKHRPVERECTEFGHHEPLGLPRKTSSSGAKRVASISKELHASPRAKCWQTRCRWRYPNPPDAGREDRIIHESRAASNNQRPNESEQSA